MLTFYITMSTIIVHVDFLLIFMGFSRFCPHYLCYVDKSWTNCHLWTNLSFFLFLTIPYFIRVCGVCVTIQTLGRRDLSGCFQVHICVFYSSYSSYCAFLCTSSKIFRAKMEPNILLKIYVIIMNSHIKNT